MDDTRIPQLPKIPFIIADVILVIFALILANSGEGPLSPILFFWVIFCVALGGVLCCLPFYVEFKNHMRLAEYDKTQANFENAERIEDALTGIRELSQTITGNVERGDRAAAAIEGLVSRLDARLALLEDKEKAAADKEDPLPAMVDNMSAQINHSVASLVRELKAGLSAGQTELEELVQKSNSELKGSLDQVGAFVEAQVESDVAVQLAALSSRVEAIAAALAKSPKENSHNVEIVDLSDEEPEEPQAAEVADDHGEEDGDDIVDEGAFAEEATEAEVPDEDAEDDEIEDNVEASFLSEEDEAELDSEDNAEDDGQEDPEHNLDEGDSEKDAANDEDEPDDTNQSEEASPAEASEPVPADETEPDQEDDDVTVEAQEDNEDLSDDEAADESEEAQPDLLADIPEGSTKTKKAGRKATSVIAQVLIGIGNKPYVRGEGPGLSMDEGVPMEFLEIGKWQWVAPESDEPVKVIIYKNDQTPAEGDPIELDPGQKRVVSPRFA